MSAVNVSVEKLQPNDNLSCHQQQRAEIFVDITMILPPSSSSVYSSITNLINASWKTEFTCLGLGGGQPKMHKVQKMPMAQICWYATIIRCLVLSLCHVTQRDLLLSRKSLCVGRESFFSKVSVFAYFLVRCKL